MKRLLLAATCLIFATSAEAFNLNIDKSFAQVGKWVVGNNNSFNGCITRAEYPGSKMWIGISKDDKGSYVYIAVADKGQINWVEPTNSYQLKVQFPDLGQEWNFEALGTGSKGLIFRSYNKLLLDHLKESTAIMIAYRGRQLLYLSLEGSFAAIDKVIECQSQYNNAPPPPQDEATKSDPKTQPKEKMWGYGTGFFVTKKGYVLTNFHVVENCVDSYHVQLSNQGIGNAIGKVVARNKANDLALIATGIQGTEFAELRVGPISIGESVWVYGYPLQDILSEPNFTPGMVAATSGLNGNVSESDYCSGTTRQ